MRKTSAVRWTTKKGTTRRRSINQRKTTAARWRTKRRIPPYLTPPEQMDARVAALETLGCNYRASPGSNESAVYWQMALSVGSQHSPDGWAYVCVGRIDHEDIKLKDAK
jgi:hypothetical protein